MTGGTGSSTTPVTNHELVDLEHSGDPDCRKDGGWMLHVSTLTAIKRLKDTGGNPLRVSGAQLRRTVSLAPMLACS